MSNTEISTKELNAAETPITAETQASEIIEFKGKKYTIMPDSVTPREFDAGLNFSLKMGYSLKYVKPILLQNDSESEVEAIVFDLMKNGVTVYTMYVCGDDLDPGKSLIETKRILFEYFRPYLSEHEKPEAVEWIKKRFSPENLAELPIWERTEPIRRILADITPDGMREMELSLSDDGNANRFISEIDGNIIVDVVENNGKTEFIPHVWMDTHWKKDDALTKTAAGNVVKTIGTNELPEWEHALKIVEDMAGEGREAKSQCKKLSSLVEKIKAHARKSRNWVEQKHMLNMVFESGLQVDLMESTEFKYIACNNGVFDTETGMFLEAWDCETLKGKYPTVFIPRDYLFEARPLKFIGHLDEVFYENTAEPANINSLPAEERAKIRFDLRNQAMRMREYFLDVLGYMLLAGNPDQVFVFLYGDGANGKSATIEILDAMLKDEHADAPIKELFAVSEDKPQPNIAKGLIKRLLTISEASVGGDRAKLSLSTMKLITGEHKTNNFRRMRAESRATVINCLPVGVTNDKPLFDGELDYAAIRRLILIKFSRKFKPEERDPEVIKDIIETELNEIFTLLLNRANGCILRHKSDKPYLPQMPEICQIAAKEFLVGQPYAEFVTSQYEKTVETGELNRISRNAVATHYIDWCEQNGHNVEITRKYLKDGTERVVLKKAELNKLTSAFKVYGFETTKMRGEEYYKCKRKSN